MSLGWEYLNIHIFAFPKVHLTLCQRCFVLMCSIHVTLVWRWENIAICLNTHKSFLVSSSAKMSPYWGLNIVIIIAVFSHYNKL